MKVKKNIKFTYTVDQKHWVGDGFHVHGLLRPTDELNYFISPFDAKCTASWNNIIVTSSLACKAEAEKINGNIALVGSVGPQLADMAKCINNLLNIYDYKYNN